MGKPKPLIIRGVEYESQGAAAKALGLNLSTVSEAFRRGKLDRVGLGKAGFQPDPITIAGRKFDSHGEAADFLGVTRAILCHWKNVNAAIKAKIGGDQ